MDWEGEEEMQRLLDMLPDVQPDTKPLEDFPTALDLELCGWDLGAMVNQPPPLSAVGVF